MESFKTVPVPSPESPDPGIDEAPAFDPQNPRIPSDAPSTGSLVSRPLPPTSGLRDSVIADPDLSLVFAERVSLVYALDSPFPCGTSL
ncbi:unnamed protein product [Arabis nemorensis]|uniref:Uncharacterized protein n=1 Tax=Arabis nemorensis TaxID=586526 RepID=A0A565C723_9BRAS|nr:unnamed protein product [Arabis nemorensis]